MNLLKNVKLEGERSGQVVEKCQIHLGLLLFFFKYSLSFSVIFPSVPYRSKYVFGKMLFVLKA